jgi:hypothetical protein
MSKLQGCDILTSLSLYFCTIPSTIARSFPSVICLMLSWPLDMDKGLSGDTSLPSKISWGKWWCDNDWRESCFYEEEDETAGDVINGLLSTGNGM